MSESQPKPSRRGFMTAAAVAATAAGAVATLPKRAIPDVAASEPTPPAPANGGGYHVSAHVERYYQTTRV